MAWLYYILSRASNLIPLTSRSLKACVTLLAFVAQSRGSCRIRTLGRARPPPLATLNTFRVPCWYTFAVAWLYYIVSRASNLIPLTSRSLKACVTLLSFVAQASGSCRIRTLGRARPPPLATLNTFRGPCVYTFAVAWLYYLARCGEQFKARLPALVPTQFGRVQRPATVYIFWPSTISLPAVVAFARTSCARSLSASVSFSSWACFLSFFVKLSS